jgi:predicted nucleotidyltransferase component of viral defense system
MNPAIEAMLAKYNCYTRDDYENALKEIIQEIALLGLWRSKFFEHAAFYGGTALRIFYGLDRFSEDLDFSLLQSKSDFSLELYLSAIKEELGGLDFDVEIAERNKNVESNIDSAFIKAGTKEHLIKIDIPKEMVSRIARNDKMKIKLEVDVNPPGGFLTEAKMLLLPAAFSVTMYRQPDIFAGKVHAILHRPWKQGRVKGRDFYDFVYFIARKIPVRLEHLRQRLIQTGSWDADASLTIDDLKEMLRRKFETVDLSLAKTDVMQFLKNPMSVDLWSKAFFLALVDQLEVI